MGWLLGEEIGANIGQAVGGSIGVILWSIIGLAFAFILLINLYGFTKAFKVTNSFILDTFKKKGFSKRRSIGYIILTFLTGILTGICLVMGFSIYLSIGLAASSLPLIAMLLYSPLRLSQLKAQYHSQESEHLIDF